jgi:hypothetical protein
MMPTWVRLNENCAAFPNRRYPRRVHCDNDNWLNGPAHKHVSGALIAVLLAVIAICSATSAVANADLAGRVAVIGSDMLEITGEDG